MIKRFLMFIMTLLIITLTQIYTYTPSALFTAIPQQTHQSSFTITATPLDDPIAQIRAARRSRGFCDKKINYHNKLATLEDTLNHQCYSPYYQKRCKALDKTRNNSKRVKRITMINHDASLFAQKYDINARNLTHTKFNHYENQLHKEFLEQLAQATELEHLYKQASDYTFFIDAIGHGIALGVEANYSKQTVTATYWADVVWQTIDIAKAIGEGIGLGIYNTAAFGAQVVKGVGNAVLHPKETARTIARGIDAVLSFFALDFDKPRRKVDLHQELDALNERIAHVAHYCAQQLSQMSLHDKVKFTTAFATEIVAPAKIFKVAPRLCNRMRPLAAGLINSICEEQVAVEIAGIGKETILMQEISEGGNIKSITQKLVGQASKIQFKETRDVISKLHPSLSKNINTIEELHLAIANISENLVDKEVGSLLKGISISNFEKLEKQTELFYDAMRATAHDISAISENTSISKDIIKRIKNHVFIDDHILYNGIKKFDPQCDMMAAWQRLMNNEFVKADLLLLQHEYIESLIMNGIEIAYPEAHEIANKIYNWSNTLEGL